MQNTSTLPTLSAYNKAIELADVRRDPVTYPRISATPQEEAVAKMTQIVYGAVLYKGQEISKERLAFMANALVAEILSDTQYGLRHISWYEIGRAIRNAVLGGGREMYGVSVSSLYAALIDYAKGEGHAAEQMATDISTLYD